METRGWVSRPPSSKSRHITFLEFEEFVLVVVWKTSNCDQVSYLQQKE